MSDTDDLTIEGVRQAVADMNKYGRKSIPVEEWMKGGPDLEEFIGTASTKTPPPDLTPLILLELRKLVRVHAMGLPYGEMRRVARRLKGEEDEFRKEMADLGVEVP